MQYKHINFDPDLDNIKGLKMPGFSMCTATLCPDAKTCRRSAKSGTMPDGDRQSWACFYSKDKPACPQYWPKAGAKSV